MIDWLDGTLKRWVAVAQAVIVLSLFIVVAVGVPMAIEAARDWYDERHPVWTDWQVSDVRRQDGAIRLRLTGYKQRGRSCSPLGVAARTRHATGGTLLASITRLDKEVVGTALPVGWHDIGEWEVRPVKDDAARVLIYFQHECANRIVYAPAIVVELP